MPTWEQYTSQTYAVHVRFCSAGQHSLALLHVLLEWSNLRSCVAHEPGAVRM